MRLSQSLGYGPCKEQSRATGRSAARNRHLSAGRRSTPEHIYGTELEFDTRSGEVRAIKRVPAGYGKVAVIEELEHRLGITPDRMIYVGDGGSDVHVMLHVTTT
jgi:phosphoserine phosphatase